MLFKNATKFIVLAALTLSFSVVVVQPAGAVTTKCVDRYFTIKNEPTADQCVKYIQQMLNITNKSQLVIDGQYGPKTTAQVAAFQQANKITVDGLTGTATWAKLCASQAKYISIAKKAGCTILPVMEPVASVQDRYPKTGCDAKTYSQGSQGTCVQLFQQLINSLQPGKKLLAEDGQYGPQTMDIVSQWQYGFKVTGDAKGVLGPNTWDSVCFWNGKNISTGKYMSKTVLDGWHKAAQKVGCYS